MTPSKKLTPKEIEIRNSPRCEFCGIILLRAPKGHDCKAPIFPVEQEYGASWDVNNQV